MESSRFTTPLSPIFLTEGGAPSDTPDGAVSQRESPDKGTR